MADTVRVGNTEIAMVWDAKFEYAPSQFLASMPREKWAQFGVDPDEVQEARVMTFLIRSQGKNILVDAGVGAHLSWRHCLRVAPRWLAAVVQFARVGR